MQKICRDMEECPISFYGCLLYTSKDGNVVEEWVSSKEEHVIYGLPEGSYTLHEELAPYEDGYVSALSLIHILVSTTVDNWDSYDTVYIGYPKMEYSL